MNARSILRFSQYVLLLGGAAALGSSAWLVLEAKYFQAYEGWRFDQLRKTGPAAPPARSAAIHSVIGRIEIPSVHLSVLILEGDDARALRLGAGHIPGTALPGQPGNTGIAGHRDTFFRPLRGIARNDAILVTTPAGSYRYQVESTAVVGPDDTQVLAPSRQPALTLVTCYPFRFIGPAPQRFVVRARRAG